MIGLTVSKLKKRKNCFVDFWLVAIKICHQSEERRDLILFIIIVNHDQKCFMSQFHLGVVMLRFIFGLLVCVRANNPVKSSAIFSMPF